MDNKQVVGLTKDVDDQEVTWELLLGQVEEEPNDSDPTRIVPLYPTAAA